LRFRFASKVRLERGEAGFTLTELIIVVAILGVVIAAIGGAFVVGARTTSETTQRYSESHDAQVASAYLATDVQSAKAIVSSGCGGSGTNLVNFSNDGTNASVSYYYQTAGGEQRVVRRACPSTDSIVVHNAAGAPCTKVDGAASCDATPATATSTFHTVKITFTDHNQVTGTNDFVFNLTGSRRQHLNAGGTSDASKLGIVTLAQGATNGLIVTGGSLNTNGSKISVNGNALATGGSISTGGLLIVGTCTGGSCPTQTRISTPIPDPFAGMTACPSASGCPTGPAAPDIDSPTPLNLSPGVYHNVTIRNGATFSPGGIYVFTGLLEVRGGPVNMSNVGLFFGCTSYPTPCTSGQHGGWFDIRGGDPITLSPWSAGPWSTSPGISIFMDRNNAAGSPNCSPTPDDTPRIFATSINISGAVYGKSACIRVSNGSPAVASAIVANQVLISGGTINVG
jgi:prepilin-type N-terminal cleavage/methylation domain-containing protein